MISILFILGLQLLQIRGDMTFKVICDDLSTIYVDGEEREAAGTGAWNQLATLSISNDARAVGIKCTNTGGPYGIMSQIENSAGAVVDVSDSSWQCSNTAEDGWATADFAGQWDAASNEYRHSGYAVDQGAWAGMSPNKEIIWTGSGADTTVYCRKTLPRNNLEVICDDIANIFVDGAEREAAGTGVWNQLSVVDIGVGAQVVGIQCQNTGGPYGIMADLKDSEGNVLMVSDDSWSCSNSGDDGWSSAGFAGGDNWAAAADDVSHGAYSSNNGAWSVLSDDSKIIWNAAGGWTVYCRKVLQ